MFLIHNFTKEELNCLKCLYIKKEVLHINSMDYDTYCADNEQFLNQIADINMYFSLLFTLSDLQLSCLKTNLAFEYYIQQIIKNNCNNNYKTTKCNNC